MQETAIRPVTSEDLDVAFDILKRFLAQTEQRSHEELLVAQYGPYCTKAKAAAITGKSTSTINAMIKDGRLRLTGQGNMVCVRSISDYMEAPKQKDFEARIRRKRPNQKYFIAP